MTTALPRAAKTSGVTEYLKLVGEAVTVEVLRRIPEGSDTDWPCPLMRDYHSRGGKGFRPACCCSAANSLAGIRRTE